MTAYGDIEMNRDEVARQVAERLGLKRGGKSCFLTRQGAYVPFKIVDALIDSELRHEADELRIQELREALQKLAKGNRSPGVLQIAREALLSEEKRNE